MGEHELRVNLLGKLETFVNGEKCQFDFGSRSKKRDLFLLLISSRQQKFAREYLENIIWPDVYNRETATNNLYTLSSSFLRTVEAKLPGQTLFRWEDGYLWVDQKRISSDLGDFNNLNRDLIFKEHSTGEIIEIVHTMEQMYQGAICGDACPIHKLRQIDIALRNNLINAYKIAIEAIARGGEKDAKQAARLDWFLSQKEAVELERVDLHEYSDFVLWRRRVYEASVEQMDDGSYETNAETRTRFPDLKKKATQLSKGTENKRKVTSHER